MGRGGNPWRGLLSLVALPLLFACTAKLGGPEQQELAPLACAAPSMFCDGLCTETQSNHEHCGDCARACPSNAECLSGACVATCPAACAEGSECIAGNCAPKCLATQMRCGGVCVDIQASALHCGKCDTPCATECSAGVCQPPCEGAACQCAVGKTRCGTACSDLNTDPSHCGGCDKPCSTLESCQAGACVCVTGLSACGDTCVDFAADDAHCGDCQTVCGAGTSCVAGECLCSGELELCDGTCSDLDADENHCGSCGQACLEGQACEVGECIAAASDGCGGAVTDATVSRLALYQAVEIDLYRDGGPVPTAMRKAPVVAGRAAVVRGFVEPGAGFVGRELSLRLRVTNGTLERVFHHKKMQSGAATQSNLNSTFQIQLPADAIEQTSAYSVELVDCNGADDAPVPNRRIPETGTLPLDAKETGSVKIAFVPVLHDGFTPNTTDAALDRYAAEVQRQYPIVSVEYSVTEPIESEETGTNFPFGDVLNRVTEKRASDAPNDDVYYYGLIKPTETFRQFCNGSCTTGVAWVLTTSRPRDAANRAGLGVGFDNDPVSLSTFPHELGHNHGRDHSPCGVSGDVNFPYQDALIGSWGYDSDASALKDPAEFWDFMSYCSPYWVSDFTYDKIASRVIEVNGMAATRVVEVGDKRTFRAMLSTGAGVRWVRNIEAVTPPGTLEIAFVYDERGVSIAEVEAYRVEMSEDSGFMLYVPPPELGWASVGPSGGPVLAY